MIPTYDANDYTDAVWMFSFIGLITASIIAVFIIIHLLLNYCRLFCNKHPDQSRSRTAYIMVLFYCILVILTVASVLFLQTNTLSRFEFSHSLCVIGQLSFTILIVAAWCFLFIIFIWRVKTSFQNSAYAYSSWIYNSLYALAILLFIAESGAWVYRATYTNPEWKITKYKHGVLMCHYNNDYSFRIPLMLSSGFMYLVINLACLYMFNRGLWTLNKDMMRRFVRDSAPGKALTLPQI